MELKKYKTTRKNSLKLIYLIVFLYSLMPVFHIFLGEVTFLGKNLYVEIPILISVILIFLNMDNVGKNTLNFFIVFFSIYIFSIIVCIFVFEYDFSVFLNNRYFFVSILFSVLFSIILKEKLIIENVKNFVFLAILFQLTFGISHWLFFPEVSFLNYEEMGKTEFIGLRESGSMISPSCYAYVLLCGLILLVYIKDIKILIFGNIIKAIFFIFFEYGILISGSRGPIILSFLLIISYLKSVFKNRNFTFFLIFVLCFCFTVEYFDLYKGITDTLITRTQEEGSGNRYEKFILGLKMVTESHYILTGVPEYIQRTMNINGVYISDNSFILLLVNFGVFSFSLFFIALYFSFHFIAMTGLFLPVLIGYVCLLTTNSILWEPWLFYYVLVLFILFYEHNKNKNTELVHYSV